MEVFPFILHVHKKARCHQLTPNQRHMDIHLVEVKHCEDTRSESQLNVTPCQHSVNISGAPFGFCTIRFKNFLPQSISIF